MMKNKPMEKQKKSKQVKEFSPVNENCIRNTIYSVGIDQDLNLKEQIAEVHGEDSEVMQATEELDRYVSDPKTQKSSWYWNFFRRVNTRMWSLYPHAHDFVRTRMTREFISELFNGGYLRALQNMAVKSGSKQVSFAREYANRYSVSVGAALLFGPRGGATMELLHFLAAERIHGQHRYGLSPDSRWSEKAQKRWYDAQKSSNWPTVVNKDGEIVLLEMAEEQGNLTEGVTETIRELWGRNPALRYYTGANRLSGDTPYQILEDATDVMIRRKFLPMRKADRLLYEQIVEDANRKGVDSFLAVYRHLFNNRDKLKPYWDRARKWLHNYSVHLWKAQNEIWLAEGKRTPAGGVSYIPAKKAKKEAVSPKKIPGTIYLNNNRYYWVVANKMKPRPLIDPKTKPRIPGGFLVDGGRYYWYVPKWIKRHRLVAKGEKYSTKNKAAAEKIALRIWNKLRKENPRLASQILNHTHSQGLATMDRAIAEKVAARLWKHIQKNDKELAARIMQDNRPKAKDRWLARIVVNGKYRHLGSFDSHAKAEAAYTAAFKNTFGYPPGYNVQCIPKIDKVWPSWEEQKTRLEGMDAKSRMPVIGQSDETEPLMPTIARMQKVDWLADVCMVVFDDNSPTALPEIAIQSKGKEWYAEIKKQGNRPIIKGATSIDQETGRIRITIFDQGFREKRVLIEEVYHIIFEIIRHQNLKAFETIRKWYSSRLQEGLDPTWHIPEAFAEQMVREEEFPGSTDLPRSIVKHAQKAFSPAHNVSELILEKILSV